MISALAAADEVKLNRSNLVPLDREVKPVDGTRKVPETGNKFSLKNSQSSNALRRSMRTAANLRA